MLRNDLIVQLSHYDNDPVTADIGGVLVDVEAVTTARDSIVLVLQPEDLQSVLSQPPRSHFRGQASGGTAPKAPG